MVNDDLVIWPVLDYSHKQKLKLYHLSRNLIGCIARGEGMAQWAETRVFVLLHSISCIEQITFFLNALYYKLIFNSNWHTKYAFDN